MFTTRPELLGTYGMVSSTHWLASASGMSVLEAGGNAFDAAVAAGLVLQVVEPQLNGLGGEVPILAYRASEDDVIVLSGQGPAPAAATIGRFADLGLELIPAGGLLAACVPGAFDAWMRLLGEHGTLRLREAMRYAIGYAEDGHPLSPGAASAIGACAELFREQWTTSAPVWLEAGRTPRANTRFRNPALAATYRRIVDQAEAATGDRDGQIQAARDLFYRGFVAEAIGDFCARTSWLDTSGRRHGGLLTADDLAAFRAPQEPPVRFDYHGYTVCKTGPWGQGPVFLQQLALLAGYDLEAMGHNSAEYIHTLVECAKLAFADREAWYGDPEHVDVPLDSLLDPGYAAARRELVGERASLELRPGSPGGREPRLPPPAPEVGGLAIGAGEPTLSQADWAGEPSLAPTGHGGGDTCHVDVVDRHGNMVAATPSGGWLQSSPAVPGLGLCLGSRAQMFWLTPGLPNSLAPGKRPRTTLTPSLALRDGRPCLAFGTPGGDTQDQWSLTFFLAHVHGGLGLQEAIDAPMFHSTHFPSSFYPRRAGPGRVVVEGRLDPRVVGGLRARGHRVDVDEDWSLGRLSAVGQGDGLLRAAANPRGMQGYAVGR